MLYHNQVDIASFLVISNDHRCPTRGLPASTVLVSGVSIYPTAVGPQSCRLWHSSPPWSESQACPKLHIAQPSSNILNLVSLPLSMLEEPWEFVSLSLSMLEEPWELLEWWHDKEPNIPSWVLEIRAQLLDSCFCWKQGSQLHQENWRLKEPPQQRCKHLSSACVVL